MPPCLQACGSPPENSSAAYLHPTTLDSQCSNRSHSCKALQFKSVPFPEILYKVYVQNAYIARQSGIRIVLTTFVWRNRLHSRAPLISCLIGLIALGPATYATSVRLNRYSGQNSLLTDSSKKKMHQLVENRDTY